MTSRELLDSIRSRARACADRDSWLLARREAIGASEVSALFGVSRFSSPYAVWQDKVHGVRAALSGEWLEWGNYLERAIATAYSDRTETRLFDLGRFTILRHPEFPRTAATLDFLVDCSFRGLGVLQVKNMSEGAAASLRASVDATAREIAAAEGSDRVAIKLPIDYDLQLRQEMLVAGVSWGCLAILVGGNRLVRFELERDPELDALILETTASWWDQHVATGIAPEIDGTKATLDALLARASSYSIDEGLVLPPVFARLWEERQRLARGIDALEEKLRAIESATLAALGERSWGVIPGVGRVGRPTGYRSRWTWPKFADPSGAARIAAEIQAGPDHVDR